MTARESPKNARARSNRACRSSRFGSRRPAPAETQVQRDGVELGAASLDTALPVDPGPHSVTATAPGYESRVFNVVLREAESQTIDVQPGARSSSNVVTEVTADPAPSSSQRTVGYVLGGVGLVGLAVGTVAGVMVLERKSTVDDNCDAAKRCNREGFDAAESGRTLGVVTTAGLVVGALGLASGAYLILSSPKEQGPHTALVTARRARRRSAEPGSRLVSVAPQGSAVRLGGGGGPSDRPSAGSRAFASVSVAQVAGAALGHRAVALATLIR